MKVHFLHGLFSHVCAISFVKCHQGSNSREHNSPSLGFDNSLYEWVWERRERWEKRVRRLQEALIPYFWCVTFHKSLNLPFLYHLKTLKGITSCLFWGRAGGKLQLSRFRSHKLMLKLNLIVASLCPCSGRKAAWSERRGGVWLYSLSPLLLGTVSGRKWVRGWGVCGEGMWESRDLFSEVNILPVERFSG